MDFGSYFPDFLRVAGPKGMALWQWCVLPLIAIAAGVLGIVLGRLSRKLLQQISRRTTSQWDDRLLELICGPLYWFWGVLVARILIAGIGLPDTSEATIDKGLRTLTLLVVFWLIFRVVGMVGTTAETSVWATSRPAMRALVPLAVRIGRIAVATIALIAILADLGYPVASLLAGLGIGGLALALAGQKTVENLFGAFSIGLDQPFSVGDTINVDGTTGTVEAIGLRSTRIRTSERTMVTMPNGRLAEMKVESFAARDRIRFAATLALDRKSTVAQVRKVIADVEATLRAQPKVLQDDVVVRLKSLGPDALDVEVGTVIVTTDFNEFGRIRQDLLLAFMDILEQAGTALASPTRTVHLIGDRAAPAQKPS